ncbi:MAG TPA: rhodanese-like domain-containing protein [Candidatus Binataceae bacterium]|nr:rhodanese-like domain-containing protein [Candidatus Binataceae bacterium]
MAIKQIEPPEAHEILSKDSEAVYLDVRTEGEFAQGHADGAINIPVIFIKGPGQSEENSDFVAIAQKLLPQNKKLVVGCASGGRSQHACEILAQVGYTDLSNIRGGFMGARDPSGRVVVKGWRDAGLPVSQEVEQGGYQSQRKRAGF